MRSWFAMLAALALWAVGDRAASAQTPLDCSAYPQSICENEDIRAFEGERAALIERLSGLDPQHEALSREQAWLDGLRACEEDAECYRTAYLNHNESLRQTLAAPPGSAEAMLPPLEPLPPEAAEEAPAPPSRPAPDDVYADHAPNDRAFEMPGWGFFTAIGFVLAVLFLLLRALKRQRLERGAEEAARRQGGRW